MTMFKKRLLVTTLALLLASTGAGAIHSAHAQSFQGSVPLSEYEVPNTASQQTQRTPMLMNNSTNNSNLAYGQNMFPDQPGYGGNNASNDSNNDSSNDGDADANASGDEAPVYSPRHHHHYRLQGDRGVNAVPLVNEGAETKYLMSRRHRHVTRHMKRAVRRPRAGANRSAYRLSRRHLTVRGLRMRITKTLPGKNHTRVLVVNYRGRRAMFSVPNRVWKQTTRRTHAKRHVRRHRTHRAHHAHRAHRSHRLARHRR